MFTSADLIEVLRRRRRRSIRPEAAVDGLPPGWAAWLSAMRVRAGAVTGATAAAIVGILAARPPVPRTRFPVPATRLQAWAGLRHPLWEPPPRDQRGLRRWSLGASLLVQVVWISLLFGLMNAQFLADAPSALGEEHVVQAVFIGTGTPDAAGGGAAPEMPQPEDAGAATPADAGPPPVASASPVSAIDPPAEPVPETAAAPDGEAAAAQVLQITDTPMPDIDFTLPPPRPSTALPEVAVRERAVAGAPMQTVEVPVLRAPTPVAAPVPVPPREVRIEVRERAMAEIAERAPAPVIAQRDITLEAPAAPARSTPDVAARERTVPLRDPAPSAAPAAPAAPAASAAPSSTASTAPAAPQPGQGARTPAPTAGRGPTAGAPPGATPSPRAADDWGDGARARDGGQRGTPSGLLGADGRPRLADGGRVGGGLPPGTITEDFARIDREGTWLRRPPTDYEPTSFDRFWVPSETLLEEWVRRSIKTVLIPIPGTSKTIRCNVALLAFGGGCGITDPNMQDVETDGRPPPDVPWKPELQEDQGSLGN
ncbi:hypothetical protein PQS31_07240 [Luteimonas sp BLCC-B24]|uniref:hypothetical protein n=1 Tax=Luteimonas sp. BLCC-B24 TaxID=3025317 RepID=UPI00234C8E0C|nr:hypothetical protein [Luteimonas sp. BLCC-B24]MDC7806613.1 hypothetical protein [Luteimonas sp. BLCC-B24]